MVANRVSYDTTFNGRDGAADVLLPSLIPTAYYREVDQGKVLATRRPVTVPKTVLCRLTAFAAGPRFYYLILSA